MFRVLGPGVANRTVVVSSLFFGVRFLVACPTWVHIVGIKLQSASTSSFPRWLCTFICKGAFSLTCAAGCLHAALHILGARCWRHSISQAGSHIEGWDLRVQEPGAIGEECDQSLQCCEPLVGGCAVQGVRMDGKATLPLFALHFGLARLNNNASISSASVSCVSMPVVISR